jgi:LuxR family maltose regulon positive regulatory protein
VRGVAWLFRASGAFLKYGLRAALELLPDATDDIYALPVAEAVRILLIKCFLYWMAGDMSNLRSMASEFLSFSELNGLSESIIWAHYFRGCACYQQNDLEAAGDDFLAVTSCRHVAPGFALIEGSFGLASVLQAQGDPSGARTVVESVMEYAQQTENDTAKEAVAAFQAYLALLQDRSHEALSWVADAARGARAVPIVTFIAPPIVTAAILIRHGTQASLAEAEQILSRTDAMLKSSHIDRFRVEVLTQQSLLYAARRQPAEALATLEAAVTLAEGGGLVQPFVDAGPPLADLLARLKLTGERDAFVQRLRQASKRSVPPGLAASHALQGLPSLSRQPQPRHPDLIELLTNRELEVLQLLALRLSNVEIARELGVTTGTVKQHTINIFRKLNAENRRQAIVQAKAMGFQIETPYPFL